VSLRCVAACRYRPRLADRSSRAVMPNGHTVCPAMDAGPAEQHAGLHVISYRVPTPSNHSTRATDEPSEPAGTPERTGRTEMPASCHPQPGPHRDRPHPMDDAVETRPQRILHHVR
jgi:hypothetical protein